MPKSNSYYSKKNPRVKKSRIFNGRGTEYLVPILQGLLYGHETMMDVARYIAKTQGKNYRSVQSVIERENGAVPRLLKKGFITRDVKGWSLTFKGLAIAVSQVGDIDTILPFVKNHAEAEKLTDLSKMFADEPTVKLLFEEALGSFLGRDFWELLKTRTNSLIQKGFNMEEATEEELKAILLSQIAQEIMKRKVYKTLSRNPMK